MKSIEDSCNYEVVSGIDNLDDTDIGTDQPGLSLWNLSRQVVQENLFF